ncbi:methyl-accepting chemotaxis protein [Geomonas sp. RF6]|uniref:methyl-accepting chemotaxis protein n=1 Tax=Geomonas sp. RF6 TaxID=2897342 RepID=UPI001E6474F6|nr:methyl-accepting chemotaxis protein [Geomonas sp. RF6]UFS71327.1 methyl-accepting chemotaxis protein [Geomonas sp. RF6]
MESDISTPSQEELSGLCDAWSRRLEAIGAELKLVASTTEDEFLSIGGKLQDFYMRSTGIGSAGEEMVREGAGETVTGAVELFRGVLDEMAEYVSRTQEETGRNSAALKEILGLLEKVSAPLAGFKKINKVLRMLGISTKIESARLGNSAAGFDTLANDVETLSVQVSEKAGIIVGRKDELAKIIEQTLLRVVQTGERQHDLVIGLLAKTRGSLEALSEIRERCGAAITEVTASCDELTRNLGEIVMSMQTHDIVRQQIEHVEESLVELQGGCASRQTGAEEVAIVCELQAAQLRHAESALTQAVRLIVANLQEIAQKQSHLLRETAKISGVSDQAGKSFFQEMEKDLGTITAALTESLEANRTLCSAMASVSDTVGDIAAFVGQIETVGEEIKLIALNSQIKSAYTGEDGAALGVLAEAIQRLSVDAIDQTGEVSRTLQAITRSTEILFGAQGEDAGDLEGKVQGMVSTFGELLHTLRSVKETLDRSVHGMDASVAELTEDIDRTTAGITVHRKVSEVLEGALAELSAVIEEARTVAPGTGGSIDFEEIARRYTMNSERQVHQALFDGAGLETAEGDGEYGDNVELF